MSFEEYPRSRQRWWWSTAGGSFSGGAAAFVDVKKQEMGVSKNRGTPKSSILLGFSLIHNPFWGTPIFGNIQIKQIGKKWRHITWCHMNGKLYLRFGMTQKLTWDWCRKEDSYLQLSTMPCHGTVQVPLRKDVEARQIRAHLSMRQGNCWFWEGRWHEWK